MKRPTAMLQNYIKKQRCRHVLMLAAALFTQLSGGCSSETAGPPTHPVTGTITLDGQPVEGAVVTFHAQDEGQNATAFTGADGEFSAVTYFDNGKHRKPGMVPGDYSITVTKLDPAGATSPGTPPKNLVPEKYARASESGLNCTVTADGPNECNIELQAGQGF